MSSHNYENILGHCVDSLKTCKELTDKYLKNDREIRSILEELTLEYIVENFEKEKADRALQKIKNDLDAVENVELDFDALHKKYMDEDVSELVNTETDIWKEMFSGGEIQEIHQKEERLSEANFDRLDDSLLCSNVFKPPIDPISKVVIKEPYKNTACGHYFDYATILNYIKERKGRAKCPYMGCANLNFRSEHLRLDKKMKEQISVYLQEHNDTAEYSEDD